jgi:hypothetical protein
MLAQMDHVERLGMVRAHETVFTGVVNLPFQVPGLSSSSVLQSRKDGEAAILWFKQVLLRIRGAELVRLRLRSWKPFAPGISWSRSWFVQEFGLLGEPLEADQNGYLLRNSPVL